MKHEWEYKKLGEVADIVGRIGFRGYTRNDLVKDATEGAITLSPSNIVNGLLDFNDCSYISWFKYNESPEIIVNEGDVLLVKTASVGKCALVKHLPHKATINPQFVLLKNIKVNSGYLTYLLQSGNSQVELRKITTGTSVPTLSQANLAKLPIPVPPLPTQQSIVSELDSLSKIIADCKETLKDYDALEQSIFYDMFGDPVKNEKGWEVKKLGEVCEIVRGGSPRPIEKFLGGEIPWIKIGDATDGDEFFITKTKEHIIAEGLSKTRLISKGSVVFANCGVSLGFARILKIDGCIHDGWLAFMDINEKEIDKIFLLKNINNSTAYLRGLAPGGTQPNLNTGIMKNFNQILPPLPLQQQFASKIEAIEKMKSETKKALQETETLFQARMDYWFN